MKNFIVFFLLLALYDCCLFAQEKVVFFANNAYGNPIIGQAAEHHNGITYIAYQGELEDPYVVSYNHANKTWDGPYKAGTSLLGKDGDVDNHGKPSLVIDGEGYIHLVFGGHGGTKDFGDNTLGNYHDGKQIHVKTKNPLDISSWEEVDNITPFGTYSQFIKMDNGDIYLIYRHGAHRSNWVYQVSTDNGRIFSSKVSFLKAKQISVGADGKTDWDSWYISFKKSSGNEIFVSYNYHFCKGGTRHDGERHHGYFMTFNTDTKEWHNVKGEILQIPITKEYADSKTLVVNTVDRWNHIGSVTFNQSNNYPCVSWYEGEDDGSNHGGAKQMTSYQWTGSEWTGGSTNLPVGARGELLISSDNTVKVLIGSKENGKAQVGWWLSSDGGRNFVKDEVLIENSGSNFQLSQFIRNAHSEAYIVATQKFSGDYSKVHLLGDNGPFKRLLSDADVIGSSACSNSSNNFSGEGQYTLLNPSKSKWLGYDVATNDALVTNEGDAEINKFNVVANGDKFNIYTSDNQKVLIINSTMGFTAMLATPTTEILASDDALFSFDKMSDACMYFIKSGAIDPNSGAYFNLNVKSNSSDIGRGTSEIANYQWEVTRVGDLGSSLSVSNQRKENEQLIIYPNPARNTIHFSRKKVKYISIYNALGKLLKASTVENNQMDVSILANGMYILEVLDDKDSVNRAKFLVR